MYRTPFRLTPLNSLLLVIMRLVLALGLLALAVPASAQIRLEPHPGSTVVVGGSAGEAMRVTTYSGQPERQGRLSRRYRGISVNRSPQAAANTPRALTYGGVAMPTLRTPQGTFVQRGNSAFRVQQSQNRAHRGRNSIVVQ